MSKSRIFYSISNRPSNVEDMFHFPYPCTLNDIANSTQFVPIPESAFWSNTSWPGVRRVKLNTTISPEGVEEIAKNLEKKGKKALANNFKSTEAKKNQAQKFLEAAKKRKKK